MKRATTFMVEKLSTGFLRVIDVVPAHGPGHTFSWDPPFTDGKWHKIKVKVTPPRGLPKLFVRAKEGYFAVAGSR